MAKTMKVRMQDVEGVLYFWHIVYVPRTANVGLTPVYDKQTGKFSPSARIISGWEYTDHDGVARFAEGTWRELVAAFTTTATNYGFTTNLS